jgi:xanthine dehydrogenase YagR molybdenum-binding subunit
VDCRRLGVERDRDDPAPVREELLRLANQMPNSPLADATPDEVVLADGRLVAKRDASAVSMRD